MIMDGAREKAIRLTRKCRFKDAINIFETGKCYQGEPVATSYYALCVAAYREDTAVAINICRKAVKRGFYSPEIFLNLGKIYLLSKRKDLAIRAFSRGLYVDRSHKGLKRQIKKLGTRRIAPISFLPRGHAINILIGQLTHRIKEQKQARENLLAG
jgi:tetratricopeptide (TPR) repeat protein